MADFTTTTHDKFIPDLWMDEVQAAYEANVVVQDSVKTADVGKGAMKGDVFHFPKVSNLTAGDIADNADIEGQAPTESEVTVTLNKKKHSSIFIQKHLANNLSKYDIRKEYTGKIGYALARQVDLDLLVTLETTFNSVGLTDASATDITDQMIRDAMEVFDEGDVPMEERMFILYPDQRSAILGIARFTESQTAGDATTPIRSGKVLDVYGMPVKFTTLISIAGTNPNQYRKGIFLHREGAILARAGAPDVEYNYIPRRKAWLLSGDVLYGSAMFRGSSNVIVVNTDT